MLPTGTGRAWINWIITGIYEYFYGMKYDRRFEPEQYPHGIPAEEFEETIMDYLPVSRGGDSAVGRV